jgi:hypothetical protein
MGKKSSLAFQSRKIGNKSLMLYIRRRPTQIFKKLQEQHLLLIWFPIPLSIDRGRRLERRRPVSGRERGPGCHPERSAGALRPASQTLRCAQGDRPSLQMSMTEGQVLHHMVYYGYKHRVNLS